MKDIRMTMAQALVRFLDQQYVSFDGQESKFVEGIATIFGHGNVLGLGQALDENSGGLKYFQGKNEQGMAHMATAFARQNNRRKIIACSSSIGPGATNMITAAACATVNTIPLLLLPSDTFACRQPDPVLQQVEQESSLTVTTTDSFKAVCRYWDRLQRPEQLMSAMINAMRVLTDPALTGAVCIAIPQDVQAESFEYPDYFFEKRVHRITRRIPSEDELRLAEAALCESKRPLVVCGGGVRYSEAGEALEQFCEQFCIPFTETQAGKSACKSGNPYCAGGIGATGNLAANTLAADADLIIAVGSRLSDFTTASKWLFQHPGVKIISINVSGFHAEKMDGIGVVGDARVSLELLMERLKKNEYRSSYTTEITAAKNSWAQEMDRLASYQYGKNFTPLVQAGNPESISDFIRQTGSCITQTAAICMIRKVIDKNAIIVGASGSLPGDLQRMWTTDVRDSYHMEYGYSCMGYEIAGALGVKLAEPDREVYAMCGDGSFYMMHSELLTALQEHRKITVLLFDNAGFGCINNLEMGNGIGNLGTEFRYRSTDGKQDGPFMQTDFAKIAEGYGIKGYRAKTPDELESALNDSKKQTDPVLIDIKVLPKTMTADYGSWWHVGVASTSKKQAVADAYERKETHRKQARKY
jgi:3D-(3,5/4)-trihydroxycyclohexane-1,2-dione acylhydrolase (decyclizing)